MVLKQYSGLYGRCEKDSKGDLYFHNFKSSQVLIRESESDETYNIIVIDRDFQEDTPFGAYLEESISLRRWREFFLEINTETGKDKLNMSLIEAFLSQYYQC